MLADTLSALRQLILDEIQIPPELGARRELYGSLFPKLSGEMLDDLAKMDPDRLETYTRSIFSGERKIVRSHFPLTIARIERFFTAQGKRFDGYDFARKLHARFPWTGNSTEVLAERVVSYISALCDEGALPAEVRETSRYELLRLLASRVEDSELQKLPRLDADAISALTVDQLLAKRTGVPSTAAFGRFTIDITPLHEVFLAEEKTLPAGQEIVEKDAPVVISRSRDFYVFTSDLPAAVFDLLEGAPREELFGLEEIAEAFVSGADGEDEAEIFRDFLELVSKLEARGALVVEP